ncbi:MAG TPA: DUF2934 domain-containing protein [Candidatus Angelobacter sp.]|nr:DUF2934 domain-containing protein [Candidatus Angelobacter sp.]
MAVKKSASERNNKSLTGKDTARSAFARGNGGNLAGTAQREPETDQEIRRRAYELYEARGRANGFDQDDWIRAEAEVLSRHKEGI